MLFLLAFGGWTAHQRAIGLRDVLAAIMPAEWINTEAKVDDLVKQQQAAQQGQALLAMMEQGSKTTANIAGAQKDMADAQSMQGGV